MKQTTRYILALAAMFLFTTGVMADNTATVTKLLDGAAPTTDPGTVVYNNGKITVTPTSGNYLTVADLKVVKTTNGSNAEARRRAPGIGNQLVLTASDPTADPSGQTEYTFTVTDTKFDYEITANFHARTDISGATVTVPGDPFTFTGTAITPNVNVTVGGTPLTQGTDFDVTYASNTNAGTASFTITGTRTYNGIITGNTFTINQAAGSISYATATVNKNNFDPAFTNPLTLTGDGTVSYSSSNTAVANVNVTTGEVTIAGVGTATITATVADGPNYTYATPTATYNLTVILASMAVTSEGYYGEYDGQAHGITVTAPEGATVRYGEAPGVYNLNASPTYTNAGGYTVYYQVTKPNYATVTGSQYVTINKALGSISYATASVKKTYGDADFTQSLTLTGDGKVSYATSNADVADVDVASGEVTITGEGTATITATAIDGTNYTYASETNTASYTITVAPAKMTVTAKGFTGDYDGQAHTITVTAPDGAKVKYGRSVDACILNNAPTYTNSGTYTVYYQVTKANYITVTGSQVVTINKAAGSISYATASVNKTKNDEAFTNPLTFTGDGKVSYSSSDTKVATVDAVSGEVTINGYGTATITATVKEGVNYVYATETATYTLIVATADMTVSASGFTGPYDGQAHGINVTAPEGATVKYGETEGVYDLSASPTYTNAGTYTVYYQVTKPNYTTVTGSATVTITKANAKVEYAKKDYTAKIGEDFDTPQVTLDPTDLVVTYSSSDEEVATVDAQTGEVTLVAPGKVTITATFAGNENYNAASDSYVLEVLQRDIDPIDEDVIYAMTDDVFFVLNEDGTIEEIKLDNTVIFDLLFTLNISGDPSESDGYDETEKCVVLNTPMSTDALNSLILSGVEPGSDEYAAIYTGLTFKVPAGTGYVIIDAQTDGEHQMMVKIGELAPIAFNHTGREKDKVLYECSEPTWVYVYNGDKISNARVLSNHRAKKERGHVKIYSVTRSSSSGQGDGIELINSETLESERWYDLQGNRIYRPTKKGVYILQGKKVIVK